MKDTLVGKMILDLSASDRRRFRELVYSPYFNKHQPTRQLVDYLLETTAEDWDRAHMESLLWPDKKPAPTALNNLLSDLLKLSYQYLQLQRLEEEPALAQDLVTDALLRRELHDHLPRQLNRQERVVRRSDRIDAENYWHRSALAEKQDRWELNREKRAYNPFLQQRADDLDVYYQIQKWRLACDMLSRNVVVKAKYELHFVEPFEAYYEANPTYPAAYPAIDLYYALYRLLKGGANHDQYREVRHKLERYLDRFPQPEQRTLYSYLLNYGVRQINSGDGRYYQEVLELYKWLLDKEIIFKNGYLTQWTYTNIITAGIRLQDYDWTERFIRSYQSYLLPEVRSNVYSYNLVNLYFERGDHQGALATLQEVSFTDAFYQLAARQIQLRIYYLEETVEPFFSLILSTERFLSRNRQLSDYQKKGSQNFLRLIKRLFKLKIRPHERERKRYRDQWSRLKSAINEAEVLTHRRWLVGQVVDPLDRRGSED